MSDGDSPTPATRKALPDQSGCVAFCMLLIGIVLLLPGLCALLFGGFSIFAAYGDPGFTPFILAGLLVGGGGVAVIRAAIRRFRR
jgi:hypothetical protein